jgi:hypothetical protein
VELDVGVPSSSELKILKGLDRSRLRLVLVGVGSSIDPRPKWASTGVHTGFVSGDPLMTILLAMIWDFAENADLLILI